MSAALDDLALARGKLQAGELRDAEQFVRRRLAANIEDLEAITVLAGIALAAGQVEQAITLTQEALSKGHASRELHWTRGRALTQRGDLIEAVASLKAAAREFPPVPVELKLDLAQALADCGNLAEARVLAVESVRDPAAVEKAHAVLTRLLRREMHAGLRIDVPSAPAVSAVVGAGLRSKKVSVIICSINPAKFARVSSNYSQLLADLPHEIIHIGDARSLCEGYNRGAERATGDILVFSHDDIEILSPDFAARLTEHLDRYDVIGVAGTTKVVDATWGMAGWPHIHGQVVHADRVLGTFAVSLYQITSTVVENVQGLDGLFFAARRETWEAVRFDEKTFDGFHLYDLDFTFSAFLAGFRLAVCNDIVVAHDSRGKFDTRYEGYAHRFVAKHRERLTMKRNRIDGGPEVTFSSAAEALGFCRLWLGCVTGDPATPVLERNDGTGPEPTLERNDGAAPAPAGLLWQLPPHAFATVDRLSRYQTIQQLVSQVAGAPRTVLAVGIEAAGLAEALRGKLPDAEIVTAGLTSNSEGAAVIGGLGGSGLGDAGVSDARVGDVGLGDNGVKANLLVVDNVLERLVNPWQALLELRRRAAPGAELVLSLFNVRNLAELANTAKGDGDFGDQGLSDIRHLHLLTLRNLRRALSQTGWRVARAAAVIDPRLAKLFEENGPKPGGIRASFGRMTLEGLSAADFHELCAGTFLITATAA